MKGPIHHSVAFRLKHVPGSEEEVRFLKACWDYLSVIPGVMNFTIHKQVSFKNPYDFELTMDFASKEDYEVYNVHPNHYNHDNETGFVPEFWFSEVEEYLEKDTVIIKNTK